jgi:hypothetical protein
LLLGGMLLGQRVAEAVGHPPQRGADLGDLARPRVHGADVQLPAGDALGVARQAGERGDDPAAQQDDARDHREREREQAGAERPRKAHGTAGTLGEQRPAHRSTLQGVGLPAGRHLALAVGPLDRGGERLGEEPPAAALHDRPLGVRAGGRELGDAGLPGHDLLRRAQLEIGLDAQAGERPGEGSACCVVVPACAGLLDERGRLTQPRVGVGLLAGADGEPRGAGRQRRRGDGEGEPERQPDPQRQTTRHRATGGSKR